MTSFSLLFLFASLFTLTFGAPQASTSSSSSKPATKVYCTPNQKCWPTDAQWQDFSSSIGGRLIKVRPWGDSCYLQPGPFVAATCQPIRFAYGNGDIRNKNVGQMQADNWAYCVTNKGPVGDCSLDISAQGMLNPLPEPGTCGLGRLSPYAVNVANEDDVVKSFAFARKYNIKLVIKNTGHEYQGRSSGLDTLIIWTNNLKSLSYEENFRGKNAILMGAGTTATEAYTFASTKNRVITLGAYGSVGVAGGFAQGGGHGPLGPTYGHGLAVDNILEFTVVTPDGKVVKANSDENKDLFWAMRGGGGGGGTWGVATQTVQQVFPDTGLVAVVYNLTTVPTLTLVQKLGAIADFISQMAKYQASWTQLGWAGYNFFTVSTITFSQFYPDVTNSVEALKSMEGMMKYMETNKNFIITGQAVTPFLTFEAGRAIFFTAGAYNTPVGFSARLFGRLIPYQAFGTANQQTQLGRDVAAALAVNSNNQNVIKPEESMFRAGDSLQIYSSGAKPKDKPFNGPSGADTGVNTAWRSSLWEVVVDSAWTKKLSQQSSRNNLAKQTSLAVDILRKYGTGCYYSESDVLESNWQKAFFGDNYARLVQIKKAIDPDLLLVSYKSIGYEGQENQASFACYQQA